MTRQSQQSSADFTAEFSANQPIDPDRLLALAAAVYRSIGVPEQEAWLAADTLVQADLWGHQ
jgi:LDH2 family malate/lactate/ureidoglycolate dehydrogenase